MKKQLTIILLTMAAVLVLLAVSNPVPAIAAPVVPAVNLSGAVPVRAVPAAQTTDKWCSGVHIVFFPGGPQGGVFAVNVYNGAVAAQNDMGATVDYVWS